MQCMVAVAQALRREFFEALARKNFDAVPPMPCATTRSLRRSRT